MQSLRASARAISTNRTNLPLGMTLGRGRAAVAFTVAYIDTRPMDSDAAPAAWAPMLSPPVAITRPLKNKPAPPAAATGLKPSCGVLCEIISWFSLTSTRWRFTSSIRRSEPGKPNHSRGRNPGAQLDPPANHNGAGRRLYTGRRHGRGAVTVR